MEIKKLFDMAENGMLNYEQFVALAKEQGVKLVDLNEGGYVSKNKYESELEAKTKEIGTLTETISTRDTDLATLKKQLEEAGADTTKLNDLTTRFQDLQTKYDTDSKNYKKQLSQQAYEFAVKEFAGTKNFSSQAAKRDFIQFMLAKQLKMENSSILGAEDCAKAYAEANADALVSETPAVPEPDVKPIFVGPTEGANDANANDPTGGFLSAMHFTPVRPMPN